MNEPFQLVTNCAFKGKEYLVQMCVLNSKKLELVVTDKLMGEDWQCEYDSSYIEALTHKTGNFKQFEVFVTMLKSGLLKTSDSITLELLTFDDLEQIRCKKIINSYNSSRTSQNGNLNKRYLILTYSVEFDRIHYPLPLDYCGPPDPSILQSNIRKLEAEIDRLKHKNSHFVKTDTVDVKKLKERIHSLIEDNDFLRNELYLANKLLNKKSKPAKNTQVLHTTLKKLEDQVFYERNHNQQIIRRLKAQNRQYKLQIEELKKSEKNLKMKLREGPKVNSTRKIGRYEREPEALVELKRSYPGERLEVTPRPVADWNCVLVSKSPELKTIKKLQNKFLSSSSSETEGLAVIEKRDSSSASRPENRRFAPNSRRDSRKSSNDRSRHSSEESKRKICSQRSRCFGTPNSLQNVKPTNRIHSAPAQSGLRSRDSSLSSKDSKQSRRSRFSGKGSGDHLGLSKKQSPKSLIEEKQDLKFSMSDLESRIHALQKLLSEGLNL